MKEIVNRLHENRQIELAKSILESNGYKVSKKKSKIVEEGLSYADDDYVGTLKSSGLFKDLDLDEDDLGLDVVLGDAADGLGVNLDNFEFYDDTNINGPEDLEGSWTKLGGLSYQDAGYYSSLVMKNEKDQYLIVVTNRDAYQFALLGSR